MKKPVVTLEDIPNVMHFELTEEVIDPDDTLISKIIKFLTCGYLN